MLTVFFSSHLQYTIHFYNIQKDHSNAIVTTENNPTHSRVDDLTFKSCMGTNSSQSSH